MKYYKYNRYIELIPVPEDQCFLVFNIPNKALDVIDEAEGLLLSELSSLQKFSYNDCEDKRLMNEFIDKGYVVSAEISEIVEAENAYFGDNNKKNTSILVTITTTTICNMDCPYCFEVHKPSIVLKDSTLLKNIKKYISQMIAMSPTEFKLLDLTWYGGEPLINIKSIQELTPMLLDIAQEHDLVYQSGIVTNGIYLTDENIKILTEECFVRTFQVTVDGPEHTHNKNRPLKGKNQENYTKILRHLSNLPQSSTLILRVNADKDVAEGIDEFLDDLESYKIWPHRIKNMQIDLRPVIAYDGANIDVNDDKYFDHRDFFEFKQQFRQNKIERYNRFQAAQGKKGSKLSWEFPVKQPDCGTWGDESGLVLDPRGNIHKCWETVHLKEESVVMAEDLDKGFFLSPYDYYINYNRYNIKTACRMCKYISVCDQLSCQKQSLLNVKPACTLWKFNTKSFLKAQYLTYVNTPELIGEPS
jgi:uncharacterized protein